MNKKKQTKPIRMNTIRKDKQEYVSVVRNSNFPFPFKTVIIPFIASFTGILLIIVGFRFGFGSIRFLKSTQQVPEITKTTKLSNIQLIQHMQFLADMYVDPATLLKMIDQHSAQIVIVDLRSSREYTKEHIKNAINIPYSGPGTQLVQPLGKYKGTLFIIYAETSYSPQVLSVAEVLLKNNMSVKILSVGWTEFRHFRNMWLPEDQWNTVDPNTYIETSQQ